MSLTPEEIAYMRDKKFQTDPPDEHGFQHGACLQEPRLSFVVRSGHEGDQPEDRRWFVDDKPVSDLTEAIALLTQRSSQTL